MTVPFPFKGISDIAEEARKARADLEFWDVAAAEAIDELGRAAYVAVRKVVDDEETMPTWSDISEDDRSKWREVAKAVVRAGAGPVGSRLQYDE